MEDLFEAISESHTPLVLVTGRAGTGRTTALTDLGVRSCEAGHRVSAVRFTARGDVLPLLLKSGSGRSRAASPVSVPREPGLTSFGPISGARSDQAVAERAATALLASLQQPGGRSLLLIDDAQWVDADSLAILSALARRAAGGAIRCVCAVRTPAREPVAASEAVDELRRSGLVDHVRMRPMSRTRIGQEVTATSSVLPEPELVEYLYTRSRGVRAAFHDAYGYLERLGRIRVVDKRAYLLPSSPIGAPTPGGRLPEVCAGLGPRELETAEAAAVLAPLGPAMPALAAEALEVSDEEVADSLETLRGNGILHKEKTGGWRFVVPQIASTLIAGIGPCTRQQLAAKAVSAVWSGVATCPDVDYLSDLVVDAGKLVDSRRALGHLLRQSTAASEDRMDAALRWLGAAVELAENRSQRMMILLTHTAICHSRGNYTESLHGARRLLEDFADHLSPGTAQELQVVAVVALGRLDRTEPLSTLAEGHHHWPGAPEATVVTRALACGMLDRWADTDRQLTEGAGHWVGGEVTSAMFARLYQSFARLCVGDLRHFETGIDERTRWPLRTVRRYHADQVNLHVAGLLTNGELRRAEQLLAEEELPAEDLQPSSRVMIAALHGDIESATDIARRAVAYRSGGGFDAGYSGMHYMIVSTLSSCGKFATARQLLAGARATRPVLAHLLDLADAEYDLLLGDPVSAAAKARNALAYAKAHEIVIGLDLVWALLADLTIDLGEHAAAERCLADIDELAEKTPTVRNVIHALFVRAIVTGDRDAAAECLRRCRERGQPLELTKIYAKLIKHGVADPAGLTEIYETLGRHGCLLVRARTRSIMRAHAIPVPGRQEAVAENEHLLAVLMSEGLSNKQLASALRTSEKSVEGRLSRLASRTGHRSRIELSKALLNGEFSAGTSPA
ncbi:AAA family ATPase [Amycolatopsis sp. WAC 04197]|uniref:AAA family ATPase n=1 Tax=Amycolatopsis sp. WAC 04197 TaxID=2203199 RepID=UPI000F77BF37|nr:AAA family ATPase [Amycolatopsis sp. WAC 04197]